MGDRFRHTGHVWRVVALFAIGIAGFLAVRWLLVPSDFGRYGFYRAGALDDARARPIAFAGRAACEECHAGTYDPADDVPKGADFDPVADNKHFVQKCEACHGPGAVHSDDPEKPVPKVGVDRLCMSCHGQVAGRPEFQPQVLAGDHGDNDPCVSCHRPHRPRTDEEETEEK